VENKADIMQHLLKMH